MRKRHVQYYADCAQIMQESAARMWYMPVWTLEELMCCKQEVYPELDDDLIAQLYAHFGGVARYVLEHPSLLPALTLEERLQILKEALVRCNLHQVNPTGRRRSSITRAAAFGSSVLWCLWPGLCVSVHRRHLTGSSVQSCPWQY